MKVILAGRTLRPSVRLAGVCLLCLVHGLCCQSRSSAESDLQFDIAIKGGRIVDGVGAPWYIADVGIKDGIISAIGRIADGDARHVIDAEGLVVAPGFIDLMGQTATPMLEDPTTALNLLTQGITTINAGEGSSAAPLGEEAASRYGWKSMAEYFQMLDLKGLPVNVTQTVGHTQVREIVIGDEGRRPSNAELEQMKDLVREAMEAGAIGVSTALIYPPAVHARTEEIAALAEVAGEYGGRYYTHMRNEGDLLLEAIDEAIDIGKSAGTPVHIFHLKTAGQQNWEKMPRAIERIKSARAGGQQVTADIYPYINNGLGIEALIHPRHFLKGRSQLVRRLDDPELRAEIRREMEETDGWENWFRHVGKDWQKIIIGQTSAKEYADLAGKSLGEMAAARDEDPWDTFFALVKAGAFALPESMSDANKILAMQEAFISFCTDVGPYSGSSSASHPRAFGSFPRLFGHYVRDRKAISLEQAVSQASALAANEVMAFDRGRISAGLAADIIVFDLQQVRDNATFAEPHRLSEGMKHVIVNGTEVLANGKLTKKRPGRVLRGLGYDEKQAACAVSTGVPADSTRHIDSVLQAYLKRHRAPGVSVAITENGRLVYARGFGYADVAVRKRVEPTSLFRIASISKPITAIAIMQLIEQKKIDLDQPIFSLLEYSPHLEKDAKYDERLKEVTIRHLLQHRGGWDRDVSFDGMFQSVRFATALSVPPPAGPDTVIRAMLGIPLDFAPGERYAYSNFGYCLLGRLIEKISGESYEAYVRKNVLAPLGIKDMVVGATRLDGRREHEVRYYDAGIGSSVFSSDLKERVPQPYGAWYLEAMDSHGGWIASSVDLARFAAAFDDPESCAVLSPDSIKELFVRPPGLAGHDKKGKPTNKYYGLGWSVDVDDEGRLIPSHGGSLPGTSTRMVRRCDGRNFVVLFNARETPFTDRLAEGILAELNAAIDQTTSFPEVDLFTEYLGDSQSP